MKLSFISCILTNLTLYQICVKVHWGSEYQTYKYWNHLNTKQIEIWYSNGPVFRCLVPETKSSEYGTGFQMLKAFLAAILLKPAEYRSSFQIVTILTTIYSSLDQFVQFSNGPVIRCPVPAKIHHLNTGLVWYSDPRCM
jgi:hypothetical protein